MVAAGMGAGAVNAIAGSGSLITFPTLLAIGYPAVTANVSNNIGLVPGSISGAYAYRDELRGQAGRARRVAVGSALGSLAGAVLLLTLPSKVFDDVVPLLVIAAALLMLFQPWVAARVTAARAARDLAAHSELGATIACFFAGIYGGYFGAAQGIILLASLGVLLPDDLARTNALKNVLALTVNAVAAVIFLFSGHVKWIVVLLIAIGSVIGARLGALVGKRVPVPLLRGFIVVLGLTVGVKLLVT
ncbi:MAG: uncharacterized protein QOK28_3670 [Actinomycetota bacterium]